MPADNTTPHSQPGGLILSMPEAASVAQALYNAVTGKTEKLIKSYNKNYFVRMPDLIQLNAKCQQTCNQWMVVEKSTSVVVHHMDDNKAQYSSFDRFQIYDISQTAPIESIVYELNVLLTIQHSPKPQNYKVVVRILSRAAMFKRMEEDLPPPAFIRYFGSAAIVVEIDYVDYVVARSFLGMVDSWVSEVEQDLEWRWIRKLQDYSHWFPNLLRAGIMLSVGYGLFMATPMALSATSTPPQLGQWLIAAFMFLWLFGAIAGMAGRVIESAIDSVLEISAIQINKGDERLLKEVKVKNRFKLFQATSGVVAVTVQALVKSSVTAWIVDFFKRPV